MSIITVSNLKGGVGKTALAVNVAQAFSERFCETLLVDFDPQGDASQLLTKGSPISLKSVGAAEGDLYERFVEHCRANIREVRPGLHLLASDVLSGLIPEGGLSALAGQGNLLSRLIQDLSYQFDNVVIDTAPVWSNVHAVALKCTELVVVPVDPSEMSVRAAIGLLNKVMGECPKPAMLVRTLVSRKATRIARHSLKKLEAEFLSEEISSGHEVIPPKRVFLKGLDMQDSGQSIYLSYASLYRSEIVHRLSFQGRTVFESKDLSLLQEGYSRIAKEIEEVAALCEPEAPVSGNALRMGDFVVNS